MKKIIAFCGSIFIASFAATKGSAEFNQTLQWHQGFGGHTIQLHVAQSATQLMNRCRSTPGLRESSSYSSLASAQSLTNATLAAQRTSIASFMQRADRDLILHHWTSSNSPNGVHVTCPSSVNYTPTRWRVLVRKNANSPSGWYVHTSFPIP